MLCLRAVEPDLRYYTRDAWIAAPNRFMAKAQHDATHQLGLRSGHLLETNGSDTLAGGFVKSPYSLPVLRVLTLSSKRRIWILPRDVGIDHASEVGAGRRVRGTTIGQAGDESE